jgi:Domain of unknown function (DUF4372)
LRRGQALKGCLAAFSGTATMPDERRAYSLSQLIEFLPHQEFQKCLARYAGNRYLKNLSCWDQYLAMALTQLTYREPARHRSVPALGRCQALSHGLPRQGGALHADANEPRNWRIYADFAQVLIAIARPLYARDPPSMLQGQKSWGDPASSK